LRIKFVSDKNEQNKLQTGQLIIRAITQDDATKLIEFLTQGTSKSQRRLFESADFWPQNEMDDYTDAVIAAMAIARNTATTKGHKTRRRPQNVVHFE
jgi:hypothetical protein